MNTIKKNITCLAVFVFLLCITSFADIPHITMNSWNDNNYEHCSLTGIDPTSGNVLWNTYLGAATATELQSGSYLGINNGLAYAVFDGSVYIIYPQTGAILMKNSDFGGSCSAYTFSSSGKLYMSGYYGPDFYVMNADGTTLSRVNSINSQYYWPESMYFSNGNNMILKYGGNNYSGEGYYPVEFDVTKYFGTIEY